MSEDFLTQLLNPTRAKLLRVFALNQAEIFTAASAGKRAGVHAAVATREIKALEKIGILKKGKFSIHVGKGKRVTGKPAVKIVTGKQKEPAWTFDQDFRHAGALSKFVHEVSPVHHKAIVGALKGSGRLTAIVLSGSFMGDPSRPADLIVAGDSLNEGRLEAAIKTLEPGLGREIRYAAFSTPEFRYRLTIEDRLLRDTLDYPHQVLLDTARLLA